MVKLGKIKVARKNGNYIKYSFFSIVILIITFKTFSKSAQNGLRSTKSIWSTSKCKLVIPDGGDCAAIGPRRPPWDCPERIRKELPVFLRLFQKRPLKTNYLGMRVEHSFGLWYILRTMTPKPTTIIESGVLKGQGSWLMRQILPDAKIIRIDPRSVPISVKNTIEITGSKFLDFSQIDWAKQNIDKTTTVIIFDDHQSLYRRVIEEARIKGFRHFILDDNYDYLRGDAYSIKSVCERDGRLDWPGFVKDNFNKELQHSTWTEHFLRGELLRSMVRFYYEFPPLFPLNVTGANVETFTRSEKHRSTPLFSTKGEYFKMGFESFKEDFGKHSHLTYVELEMSSLPSG